ncbi:carcinine transporter isoform X2 [Ischnura elegans]|uniref:carcinine transporter isoform X2 n=1 Tax=Ischnura elegans TaxID=197161 RepID=UPI001ED8ACCB|nr:carcinine transporter isoform X2 [Ischnura elegans]
MGKERTESGDAEEEHPHQKGKKEAADDGPMDLDDILPAVGEFGRYQKLLLWLVCLPACVPCGFCAFNQLFMADVPEQIWCKVPELATAQPPIPHHIRRLLTAPPENPAVRSYQQQEILKTPEATGSWVITDTPPSNGYSTVEVPLTAQNTSMLPESAVENMELSSCLRYNVNFTREAEIAGVPLMMLRPSPKWPKATCRPDWGWEYFSDSVYSSIVIDFNLVCEQAIYPTIGLAALNAGGPIGVYVFGLLNDRVGRRLSFFSCLATLLLGGILTAAAPNFWSWAGCRFIVGLTIPAIYQIPFIISLELVGPNYRSFVTVMTCLFYTLGMIVLAGITYMVRDWVCLALVTSAPFLLYFGYWWFLPESPRWLLAKGRFEEASAILETLARVNGTQLPSGFVHRLKQKMTLHRSQSEESRLKKGPGVMALCRTPNMRLKTALITLNWFANEMVYVGLSYYGPSLGSDQYVSFLLSALVEVPSYLACWFVMDHWGRRWPLCVCMVLSGVSSIVTVLLPEDAVTATLLLFLLAKSAISASFLIIYPFAGELYPTQLRGIGIGASAYIAGLGLVIIPFIVYLGSEMLVLPLVILGVISVVGGLSGLRLPETLHHRLPQTVEEGEEFGKDWNWRECIRCIPIRPTSPASSYEDLNANDGTEFEEFSAAGQAMANTRRVSERSLSRGQQESVISNADANSVPPVTDAPTERTPLGSIQPNRRRSLRGRLARQSSIMETPMDSSGAMTITYWY